MFKRFHGAVAAKEMLLDRCLPLQRTEHLSSIQATGRVLSQDILSPVSLPGFDRAAMDGFAVRSEDTRGAKPNTPVILDNFRPVRTGMPVPGEYDCVVMKEDARMRRASLEVTTQLHAYKNISLIGEDIRVGEAVFSEGHTLRPPDVAMLSALGIVEVEVYEKPKVVIIPTGGELVAIGARSLCVGEAYEINGLMARLYAENWGAMAQKREIVPDDEVLIREAISTDICADMIIIIGGTSVGEKDYAPRVLEEMGELFVHGVRLQPGKPTAFGVVAGKIVICLPGYPVAALSDLYIFVRPALQKMAHRSDIQPKVPAKLARKIPSRPGYLSMVRVALKNGEAEPIMISGAGILSSVARADGFVLVPEDREGIEEGETVEVVLFE
jgi:molybdopterin molybdotransferase